MMGWIEQQREKQKRDIEARKLAKDYGEFAKGLDTPSGNPFGQWAQGVAQRTMHPLETLAGAAQQSLDDPTGTALNWANPIGAAGNSLASLAGIFAGKGAKTADIVKLELAQKLKQQVPAKTEFELAHEVAQRNAALPVEQGGLGLPPNNTAMDRAKAMGFDTPAYHVSDADIQAFDMVKSGSNTLSNTDSEWANRLANAGVWSANEDVTLAARRALGKEGGMFGDVVYPLLIENPKTAARTLDTLERKLKKGKLKNTTKVNDEEFGVTSYISPNPSNIRSRFAAFDPMQRNSANILAGGAAGAVGLSTLADLINQEQYK